MNYLSKTPRSISSYFLFPALKPEFMMKRREGYTILKTRSDAFAKLVMTAPKFRCLRLLPLFF